jgi:4-diphosphocytidyl-2-C-methyl-D-erythritol kinase
MLLNAPAKINLTLRVLSRRADGYHEISSLMRAIRLFDEVEIALPVKNDRSIRQTESSRLRLHVKKGLLQEPIIFDLPTGTENIAYRAAELALGAWGAEGAEGPQIDIALTKNIPVAAGLAGGSADAAAVLLGLAREFRPEARLEEIATLGAALGADVPFCVYACAAANPEIGYKGSSAALAEGIGERITPLPAQEPVNVILIKPPIEVSSSAIYELWDKKGRPSQGSKNSVAGGNDLEAPCAEAWPIVAETLAGLRKIFEEESVADVTLRSTVAKTAVQMSGSGPTVFACFPEQSASAKRLYERVKTAFPGMFTCLTETL